MVWFQMQTTILKCTGTCHFPTITLHRCLPINVKFVTIILQYLIMGETYSVQCEWKFKSPERKLSVNEVITRRSPSYSSLQHGVHSNIFTDDQTLHHLDLDDVEFRQKSNKLPLIVMRHVSTHISAYSKWQTNFKDDVHILTDSKNALYSVW